MIASELASMMPTRMHNRSPSLCFPIAIGVEFSRFSFMEFSACSGSTTAHGRPTARATAPLAVLLCLPSTGSAPRISFTQLNTRPTDGSVHASCVLTEAHARVKVRMVHYTFPAGLLHSQLRVRLIPVRNGHQAALDGGQGDRVFKATTHRQ